MLALMTLYIQPSIHPPPPVDFKRLLLPPTHVKLPNKAQYLERTDQKLRMEPVLPSQRLFLILLDKVADRVRNRDNQIRNYVASKKELSFEDRTGRRLRVQLTRGVGVGGGPGLTQLNEIDIGA